MFQETSKASMGNDLLFKFSLLLISLLILTVPPMVLCCQNKTRKKSFPALTRVNGSLFLVTPPPPLYLYT